MLLSENLERTTIHPMAIVDASAVIGKNVSIGPYSIIHKDVVLADNVKIHSHVVIDGVTTIGESTEIYPFAVIGAPTPDKKYQGERSELIIGKNNVIREYTTINPGTAAGGMVTKIGDNCLLMISCHVAHDCIIGNNVILVNHATLGGHVEVGDNAIIGGLAAVHQFVKIGKYAIVGGMSPVDRDVIPYGAVKGERAHLAGINIVGLRRGNFAPEIIRTINEVVNKLFFENDADEVLIDRVTRLKVEYELVSEAIEILDFVTINSSKRSTMRSASNGSEQ